MSEIFIRREADAARPRVGALFAWVGAIILVALIVIGVRYLRKSATPEGEARPDRVPAPSAQSALTPVAAPDPALALLAEARALRAADRLAEARAKLFEALAAVREEGVRRAVEGMLGELNLYLLTNPYPMEEKTDYIIQRGDSLALIARRHGTTVELLRKSNNIRGDLIRPGDRLRVLNQRFSVHISKSRNDLELRLNGRFFKRYRVGTGKFDRTPAGQTKIVDRIEKPTWWRPDGTPLPFGHPENVLGTHWLALDIKGYGIHGTWEPDTIGRAESAGCIRLLNSDIEELFTLLPVGTEVTIEE